MTLMEEGQIVNLLSEALVAEPVNNWDESNSWNSITVRERMATRTGRESLGNTMQNDSW